MKLWGSELIVASIRWHSPANHVVGSVFATALARALCLLADPCWQFLQQPLKSSVSSTAAAWFPEAGLARRPPIRAQPAGAGNARSFAGVLVPRAKIPLRNLRSGSHLCSSGLPCPTRNHPRSRPLPVGVRAGKWARCAATDNRAAQDWAAGRRCAGTPTNRWSAS